MEATPSLLLIRQKYAFPKDQREFFIPAGLSEIHTTALIFTPDAMLFPLRPTRHDQPISGYIFGQGGVPDWVDFYEVLELGTDVGSAPPFAEDDPDDDEAFFDPYASFWGPDHRPSGVIARMFRDLISLQRAPSFQRRLLILAFEDGAEEFAVERWREGIRKRLGPSARGLWHSRFLCAFGFVDDRECQDILNWLGDDVADADEIFDFMVVKPLAVPLTSSVGASPMKSWVEQGWRTSTHLARVPPRQRDHPLGGLTGGPGSSHVRRIARFAPGSGKRP